MLLASLTVPEMPRETIVAGLAVALSLVIVPLGIATADPDTNEDGFHEAPWELPIHEEATPTPQTTAVTKTDTDNELSDKNNEVTQNQSDNHDSNSASLATSGERQMLAQTGSVTAWLLVAAGIWICAGLLLIVRQCPADVSNLA